MSSIILIDPGADSWVTKKSKLVSLQERMSETLGFYSKLTIFVANRSSASFMTLYTK